MMIKTLQAFFIKGLTFPLILFLLLAGYINKTLAQPNVIETGLYSVNDGLADRFVTDILQTSNGFLWIATNAGLNKFDGYSFTIFNDHPNNNHQISATNIKEIHEINGGRLLILYDNNLVFFDLLDPRSFEYKKIEMLPEDGIKGIVRDIKVNPQRKLQVLSQVDSTYNIYELAENHFQLKVQLPAQKGGLLGNAQFIQLKNGPFLLNESQSGLKLFSAKGELIKHFKRKDFDSPTYPYNYPCASNFMHESKDSTIWIAFSKLSGVFQVDLADISIRQFSQLTNRKRFARVWEDDQRNLIFAQSRGGSKGARVQAMYCLKPDQTIVSYNFMLDKRAVVTDVYSRNFAKNIIIGHDTGMRILKNNQSKVKYFSFNEEGSNEASSIIKDIEGDLNGYTYFINEEVWIYQIDLYNDEINELQVTNLRTNRPFKFDCPVDLHYDIDSSILWGISCAYSSNVSRIHKIDLSSCTSRTYIYKNKINAFAQTRDRMLWMVGQTRNNEGKLVSFDPNTEKFATFFDREGLNPLDNAIPRYIMENRAGGIWIGTENGLFKIDRDSALTTRYARSEDPGMSGLTSNSVYVINENQDGRLWLGTANGLNILNPQTGEIETYDKSHGLTNNIICGLIADDSGNYWISTSNGISYFEYSDRLFRNFYQADGLSHDEFRPKSFFKDENGRVYFGSANGLNVFEPSVLLETNDAPKVVLTEFIKYNARNEKPEIINKNLDQLNEVIISPYDTYFQFNFILPNFTNAQKNQFSVWLEDFDNDWIYLGNTPSVRYNKLPPGKYTLHIDGAGPNGNWSDDSRSIDIIVKPIFYKTWWFYLLATILIGGGVWAFFHYLLEQRLKVERIRMKLSSDLHDEMSGLLSGIAMQTDILQMMTSDSTSRSRLQIIGEVSRKAMSKMSDVIWSIDSRKDRVQDLIQRMQEHADEMLLPLNISYQFDIAKIDQNKLMPVTIRQNLYFIFKESINNVAKHSNATNVQIEFGNRGNTFEMKVKDNGQKFTSSFGKTGQGITNLKMRADRIKANLSIKQKDGFSILLKMNKFA